MFLKILTTWNLHYCCLLESVRLVIDWNHLLIVGEMYSDEAVVSERGQILGVVKQGLEEADSVLLDIFLL